MPLDPLLSLLVGAFGAALLGLLGASIQARREHRAWASRLRWEVYRDFLAFMDRETMKITSLKGPKTKPEVDEWVLDLVAALTPVTILGPRYVTVRAAYLMNEVLALKPGKAPESDARDKFLNAIQTELRMIWWPARVKHWFGRRTKKRSAAT